MRIFLPVHITHKRKVKTNLDMVDDSYLSCKTHQTDCIGAEKGEKGDEREFIKYVARMMDRNKMFPLKKSFSVLFFLSL